MVEKGTISYSQIKRLNRVEEQLRSIANMIDNGRYCMDILIQIRSVINALQKVQENTLRHHLKECAGRSMNQTVLKDCESGLEDVISLISNSRIITGKKKEAGYAGVQPPG